MPIGGAFDFNGAEKLATVGKLARQLFHRVDDQEWMKSRRKLAGCDEQYPLNVLALFYML